MSMFKKAIQNAKTGTASGKAKLTQGNATRQRLLPLRRHIVKNVEAGSPAYIQAPGIDELAQLCLRTKFVRDTYADKAAVKWAITVSIDFDNLAKPPAEWYTVAGK